MIVVGKSPTVKSMLCKRIPKAYVGRQINVVRRPSQCIHFVYFGFHCPPAFTEKLAWSRL